MRSDWNSCSTVLIITSLAHARRLRSGAPCQNYDPAANAFAISSDVGSSSPATADAVPPSDSAGSVVSTFCVATLALRAEDLCDGALRATFLAAGLVAGFAAGLRVGCTPT